MSMGRTDEGAKRPVTRRCVYSRCGARSVRGAVFRDIGTGPVRSSVAQCG